MAIGGMTEKEYSLNKINKFYKSYCVNTVRMKKYNAIVENLYLDV
ncbi:MAG: hypothetical protein ABH808_02865 [Candidatus Kuenenbacteria bacterium]